MKVFARRSPVYPRLWLEKVGFLPQNDFLGDLKTILLSFFVALGEFLLGLQQDGTDLQARAP